MSAAWESSESLSNIAAALVTALGELGDIATNHKATIPGANGKPGYSYEYLDLAGLLGDVRPVLAKHGLVVMQAAVAAGEDVAVTTVFLHTSGEWMRFGPFVLPGGKTAQQAGAAVTYARRYALMAALGVATTDDDGAGAGERETFDNARPAPNRRTPPRQSDPDPDTVPPPVPAPRTRYEEQARRMIAGVSGDRSKALREAFQAEFGTNLLGLPDERHEEALGWVQKWIVASVAVEMADQGVRVGGDGADEAVEEARRRLEAAGIDTTETDGHTPPD